MKAIGEANGVATRALLTPMHHPLGRAAGNALEVRECIEVLKGGGPDDVRRLSAHLAAHMVHLAGLAPSLEEAEARVGEALRSGRGLEKFRDMVEAQGGDPRVIDDPSLLPAAPHREVVRAHRTGHVEGWDALRVGHAVCALGAGREVAGEAVDLAVGVIVRARPGERVRQGEALLELYHRDSDRLAAALALLEGACPIGEEPPPGQPLIHHVLH
jgi:pyrimidine-nucleoside phosphorylase